MNNIFIWFINRFNRYKVTVHAAQVTFFILVSFFPFMMFLITLLQYTPLNADIITSFIEGIIPGSLGGLIEGWLMETYRSASGTVLSVTVITTLWAASKAFTSIVFELDQIYNVEKRRGLIARRFLALLYTVVFTLMIILSLIILVYGNQILQLINSIFPFLSNVKPILFMIRSAVAFLLFVSYFVFLYRFVPNHKSTFRDELPGAGLAAFLWIAFSYLYSFYIDYNSAFSSVYGSLTHIVLLMLWMYFCIIFIFTGALFNRFLKEKGKLHFLSSLKEIRGIIHSYLENRM